MMRPINYEFEIYDDIIHGELQPKKLTESNILLVSNYIQESNDECNAILLAEFKKFNNQK